MIARVVALNSIVGAVFGWVYAQHSLESAMLCHVAAHVGLLVSSTMAFRAPFYSLLARIAGFARRCTLQGSNFP